MDPDLRLKSLAPGRLSSKVGNHTSFAGSAGARLRGRPVVDRRARLAYGYTPSPTHALACQTCRKDNPSRPSAISCLFSLLKTLLMPTAELILKICQRAVLFH